MHWCVLLSDIWLHSLARSPADWPLLFGAHMHPLWPGRQWWDWYLQELQQRGKTQGHLQSQHFFHFCAKHMQILSARRGWWTQQEQWAVKHYWRSAVSSAVWLKARWRSWWWPVQSECILTPSCISQDEGHPISLMNHSVLASQW